MKKWIVILMILCVFIPTVAQAEKHYGPLWAVWTHSEDPAECMAKTTFWMVVLTFGSCYVIKKVSERQSAQYDAKGAWKPAFWIEQDEGGRSYPLIGAKVIW